MRAFPASPPALLLAVLLPVLLIGGCAADHGQWPSLAPRPGEAAPMVPRATLACATCAPAEPAAPAPTRAPPPVPADAEARLATITADIERVAEVLPPERQAAEAAIARAAGQTADSPAGAAADIARSRWLETFVPLAGAERRLDALEDDLAGTAAEADFAPRLAALRQRLATLSAERDSLP